MISLESNLLLFVCKCVPPHCALSNREAFARSCFSVCLCFLMNSVLTDTDWGIHMNQGAIFGKAAMFCSLDSTEILEKHTENPEFVEGLQLVRPECLKDTMRVH